MLAKLRPRSAYDVMAALALVVAVSTGGAYAASTITGADVVDESLTGADVRGRPGTSTTPSVNGTLTSHDISGQPANAALGQPFVEGSLTTSDIRANTLTGSDVNEATLAKVPAAANADKLGGVVSTGFVQGHGKLLSNRLVLIPGDAQQALLTLPGLGYIVADCDAPAGRVFYVNNTGGNVDFWMQEDDGDWFGDLWPSNPGSSFLVASTEGNPGRVISLGVGNSPGPRRIATLHVFAFQGGTNTPCGFQAQANTWTSP